MGGNAAEVITIPPGRSLKRNRTLLWSGGKERPERIEVSKIEVSKGKGLTEKMKTKREKSLY